jgi:arylsulfatase A-like enzyme
MRVDDRVAGLIDLPPTLLELLGIPDRPASWQGENLGAPAQRAALFSERFHEVAVTSDGSAKAIFSPGLRRDNWRFFDLDSDAGESEPTPDLPATPALQREHRRWVGDTPLARRDHDAEPVGTCGVRHPEEKRALRDALRALGYLQ